MSRGLVIIVVILAALIAGAFVYFAFSPPAPDVSEPVDTTEPALSQIPLHNNLELASRAVPAERKAAAVSVDTINPDAAPELWFAILISKLPPMERINKSSTEQMAEDPGSPLGAGRTAMAGGWVTLPKLAPFEKADVQFEFKHGLNTGRKGRVAIDGSYQIGGLYPGLNIVRFTSGDKRSVDVEMLLKPRVEIRQDVTLGERAFIHIRVNNTAEVPIRSARVALGEAQGAESFGIFASGPDVIATISAKGYESRRELLHVPEPGSSDRLNIMLRRAGSLRATFELLGDRYVRPIAVLLPSSVTVSQKYPFESAGIVRAADLSQEIEFAGVPHEESFDICLFANDAIAVPPLIHLKGIDNSEPVARLAKFAFEERWIVGGRVVSRGKPVAGAIVRAEVDDIGFATQRMFQDHGGLDRVALPILPFARRIVTTDSEGKFRVETFDMLRPATIVVEAAHTKRKYIPMPDGGFRNIGDIDMNPDEKLDDGPRSSLTIEFSDEKPRSLKLFTLSSLEVLTKSQREDAIARMKKDLKGGFAVPCKGKLAGPISVEPGDYTLIAGARYGAVFNIDIKIDGPATVPIR
ncbi:MAG: hypothetical protein ACKVS6_07270 [Planctomycetota bacterium]